LPRLRELTIIYFETHFGATMEESTVIIRLLSILMMMGK